MVQCCSSCYQIQRCCFLWPEQWLMMSPCHWCSGVVSTVHCLDWPVVQTMLLGNSWVRNFCLSMTSFVKFGLSMPLAADNSRFMQSFSHKAEVARAQLAKACSAAAQIVRTVGKPLGHRSAQLGSTCDKCWARCRMARRREKKVWHGWESESLPYAFTYVPNLFLLGVWNYNLKTALKLVWNWSETPSEPSTVTGGEGRADHIMTFSHQKSLTYENACIHRYRQGYIHIWKSFFSLGFPGQVRIVHTHIQRENIHGCKHLSLH